MTLSFIRGFFVVISGVVGYFIGSLLQEPDLGWMIGCLSALVLILLEMQLRRVSVRGLSSMVFGLVLGIIMAKLISDILSLLPIGIFYLSVSKVVLTVVFSYLGAVMALRGKDEFNLIIPYVRFKQQDAHDGVILVDTSAIIDGRIMDIFKTNFMQGTALVPRFVLQELQALADSADDIKRERGRRGMELLRAMQEDNTIDIQIHEDDLTGSQDVDSKLITLAKMMDARICTTDFNLSRVANLQGVRTLNIHDLARAVKLAIHPGERFDLKLIREGKEGQQAVGFLEDGTMVVVSDGQSKLGQTVTIVATSALQTNAGRMIFAKIAN